MLFEILAPQDVQEICKRCFNKNAVKG